LWSKLCIPVLNRVKDKIKTLVTICSDLLIVNLNRSVLYHNVSGDITLIAQVVVNPTTIRSRPSLLFIVIKCHARLIFNKLKSVWNNSQFGRNTLMNLFKWNVLSVLLLLNRVKDKIKTLVTICTDLLIVNLNNNQHTFNMANKPETT
jgi:hypothetical protein